MPKPDIKKSQTGPGQHQTRGTGSAAYPKISLPNRKTQSGITDAGRHQPSPVGHVGQRMGQVRGADSHPLDR